MYLIETRLEDRNHPVVLVVRQPHPCLFHCHHPLDAGREHAALERLLQPVGRPQLIVVCDRAQDLRHVVLRTVLVRQLRRVDPAAGSCRVLAPARAVALRQAKVETLDGAPQPHRRIGIQMTADGFGPRLPADQLLIGPEPLVVGQRQCPGREYPRRVVAHRLIARQLFADRLPHLLHIALRVVFGQDEDRPRGVVRQVLEVGAVEEEQRRLCPALGLVRAVRKIISLHPDNEQPVHLVRDLLEWCRALHLLPPGTRHVHTKPSPNATRPSASAARRWSSSGA